MRWWQRPFGVAALVVLAGVTVVLGATAFQVHQATHPERVGSEGFDFDSMMLQVVDVEFQATDGIELRGWLIAGNPELPPLILCHERGASKGSLINLALELRRFGFPMLLFDFRGHGASGDAASTFGIEEKRDVIGAIDYMIRRQPGRDKRVGVYGVGMGAHAAVLAAVDRPPVRVLVLDGLYPDASRRIVSEVFHGWDLAEKLELLPRTMFDVMHGGSTGTRRASDVIPGLVGRDLLFLAPAADAVLGEEIRRMYDSVPEQPDVDGNLLVLPVLQADGLYGDELDRYNLGVSDFFASRFGAITPAVRRGGPGDRRSAGGARNRP